MNKFLNRYWSVGVILGLVLASTWVASQGLQDTAETARQQFLQSSGTPSLVNASSSSSSSSSSSASTTTADPAAAPTGASDTNNNIWGF